LLTQWMFSFWTTRLYYESIHSYLPHNDQKCIILIASLNHMHTRLSSWHCITCITIIKARIWFLFHVVHCRRNWQHFWHQILIHDICSHVNHIDSIVRKNLKLFKTTITQHHSNRTLTTRPRYGIRPNCIKPRSASGATSDIRELTSFGSKTFCLT